MDRFIEKFSIVVASAFMDLKSNMDRFIVIGILAAKAFSFI